MQKACVMNPSGMSVIIGFDDVKVREICESIDEVVENVILLQATNPLRPDNLLQDAFVLFQEKEVNSLFTVSRSHHKLGKITNHKFIPYNYEVGQRSQDLEPLYYENGLLYITKASVILNNEIITKDAFPLEVNHPFANVDIDTQEDFDYAEYLVGKFHVFGNADETDSTKR